MPRRRPPSEARPDHATATGGALPRRIFLKRFSFGAAAVMAGMPALARALAVTFESHEDGIELDADGTGARRRVMREVARSAYATAPALALDASGNPWVAWCEESADKCVVRAQAFSADDGAPGLALVLCGESSEWMAFQPVVAAAGAHLAAAWTEVAPGGRWRVMARHRGGDGAWGDARVLASAEGGAYAWRPVIAPLGDEGVFALAWEERAPGGHTFIRLMTSAHDASGNGTPFSVAVDGSDLCRPALATTQGANPRTALAFDRYRGGGSTTVELAFVDWAKPESAGDTATVSDNPATNIAPAVAFTPDGDAAWVGWHTNTDGADGWDIPRWFRVARVERGARRVSRPAWPPPMMDLAKTGTDQGTEFVRLAVAADGTLAVVARASHRFVMQVYRGGSWSPLYRFPKDGWGGRGQHAHARFDAEGRLWVARRDVGANVLDCVDGLVDGRAPAPVLSRDPAPAAGAAAVPLAGVTPHLEFPLVPPTPPGPRERITEGMNTYFGDIHGHTWMSDGMGDVDEHYRRARDVFHDDFCAVTDHDHFVQRKLLRAEFELQKSIAGQFDDPGRFVTLLAQEWTTGRIGAAHGFGHKNVYAIGGDCPLLDHMDDRWRDAGQVYEAMRAHDMLCIPHHVGWTGVDWDGVGTDVQPLVEICSVHGVFEHAGNTPIPHRGHLKGMFVQDGLAAGRRFGLTGGSDQHGLLWQHGTAWKRDAYRAGLTGVIAPELTREALFDAMRRRRTFATTGVKMRLAFHVGHLMMGEEGSIDKPPAVHVDVLALAPVKWVTIVRNNEEILRYGGEGPRTRLNHTDTGIPEGRTSWYYARVELMDGNMAWSSPVWVTTPA